MGEAKGIQVQIALNYLLTDPGFRTLCASSQDLFKGRIELHFKNPFLGDPTEAVRNMKSIKRDDPSWIGREPCNFPTFKRHGKDPIAIGFNQQRRRDDRRGNSLAHGSLV